MASKLHRINLPLKGTSNSHTNAQDTVPESNGLDETALVDAKPAGLLISLAPDPKAVDLDKSKHFFGGKTQPADGERSGVAALDISNAPPQSISHNDCDMEANCKRGHKHKIKFFKPLSHSLVAKIRKFCGNKKLNSWNWKRKRHTQPTTEQGEALVAQQGTGKAAMEPGSSHGNNRQDWEAIRAISNDQFRHLLLRCLNVPGEDPIPLHSCEVAERLEGGFHLAVIIYVSRNGGIEPWVIKVPAHGTARFWTEQDTYMMRREVEIMRQISFNTDIPVPKIKDFYTGLDDEFGAPWVVMEKLPGNAAHSIWFDESYSRETAYLGADSPTEATHRRRVNFLKSLAEQMVKLQRLKFDKIGMAKIQYPHDVTHNSSGTCEEFPSTVGPAYYWPCTSDITRVVERGPFPATQDFIQPGFQALFDLDMLCEKYPEPDEEFYALLGVGKIMKAVFDTAAFNPDGTDETFVIRHDDLNFQNILVDENGNVTGIIDWDGAFVAPRCIGPAAAPLFLSRDWLPGEHGEQLEKLPHMAWKTYYYRNIYAAAMHKAELKEGLSHDAQYTTNSALYQATLCAIYEGGDFWNLTEKILRSLPGFMMDPYDFTTLLGRGFPAAEDMLEREITKLCKPTLPSKEYMKELEEDVRTNTDPEEVDPINVTVEPLTPEDELDGSVLSPGSPAETSTDMNLPESITGENNEAQTVLPSPSPALLQEDDDETQSLAEFCSIFSQESSSNKSSPCSSLGFEEGRHLQAGPQLQSHPNVKQDIINMKVSIPTISHILYRTV